MTLLHASSLALSYGSRGIFEGLTLTLEEGERVGLVGVNGSGKSSLMRVLARAAPPDHGEVQLRRGALVTYLPQEPTFPAGATVASELEVARAPLRAALDEHAGLAARLETERDPAAHARLLADLAAASDRVEGLGGWDTAHEARRLLDRLGVKDWDRPVAELSGGARKRVAIARALLTRPDLLLLDEPTNHLDADTVDWLEEELDRLPGALLLVTHDRYFLDDLVDRILEIRAGRRRHELAGKLRSVPRGEARGGRARRPRAPQARPLDRGRGRLAAPRRGGAPDQVEGARRARAAAHGGARPGACGRSGAARRRAAAALARGPRGARSREALRGADGPRRGELHPRARRAGGPRRPERRREDDLPARPPRRARARRGRGRHRQAHPRRVLRPAAGEPRPGGDALRGRGREPARAHGRGLRRAVGAARRAARLPRRPALPAAPPGREGEGALGRRAQPAAPRAPLPARRERARPRRAHERPRPRDPQRPRAAAPRVRRLDAARHARPLLPRQGGDRDPRLRGRRARHALGGNYELYRTLREQADAAARAAGSASTPSGQGRTRAAATAPSTPAAAAASSPRPVLAEKSIGAESA